jgi:ligand-binding sensor domain-containing protein
MRLLFFLVHFIPYCIFAQNHNYIHYNTNNSKLPHDIVYRLSQDKAGFIWISTDDGLVRFDGTEMVNFDKGFASKYIIGTNEEHGRLWACTWKGGIYYLKGDSAVLVNSTPKANYFTVNTNNILVFDDLVISRSFHPYMVLKYDSTQNLLTPYSLKQKPDTIFEVRPGEREYYEFYKTKEHRLYAYSAAGIFEVKQEKLFPLDAVMIPEEIWQSPTGTLYFLKDRKIYITNGDFSQAKLFYEVAHTKFKNRSLTTFRVLPSGNVCLGFLSAELPNASWVYYLINTRTGEMIDFSQEIIGKVLSADVLIDHEGTVWLSSDGRGLFHIFDIKYKQIGGNQVFENSTITALLQSGRDSLYIGTKEGLYLMSNNTIYPIQRARAKPDYVTDLFKTNQGVVAAVTDPMWPQNYLIKKNKLESFRSGEQKFLKDYWFWIDSTGACHLTDRTGKINYASRASFQVVPYDIVEDNNKSLWYFVPDGLYFFEPNSDGKRIKRKQLEGLIFNCITYVENKGLWIGTNQGLFLITETGALKHWGTNEGLMNTNIRCFHSESKNSLWIGTQNGLYNMRDDEFFIYKRRDGLIADDVTHMIPISKNELALGSSKGITIFLMQPTPKQLAPVLSIEELKVNGIEKPWHQKIDVPFNNTISLKYRLTTFIYPELITYEYRLNENQPWINTQNNTLIFSDLKPGSYHLQIRAKKYNSTFSAPVVINFTILEPWWRSSYVYIGVLTVLLVLVYLYFNFKIRKQKTDMKLKQEFAELRMKALQAQLNPHFISNALNSIQYYILKQDEIAANNYLSQFTSLTRLFLEVSRHKFISLKTELELLNHYLNLEKLRFENKFDYVIDMSPSIDTDATFIPGLLIQPFVENSINHGILYLPKDKIGLVSIKIKQSDDLLKITINDNGIGRKKAREIKNKLPRSFSSHSTQIVEEIKQAYNQQSDCHIGIETFDMKDDLGQPMGTCVYISVQIKNKTISQPI